MHPLNTLATLVTWAARNTAYNLRFVPEERLAWKPAPDALSALEIAAHAAETLAAMRPILEGGEWTPSPFMFRTAEEAGAALTTQADAYAGTLLRVAPEELGRTVVAGRRRVTVPLGRAASMAVVDLIHHHGQIAYLQTLLGDKESHFAPE